MSVGERENARRARAMETYRARLLGEVVDELLKPKPNGQPPPVAGMLGMLSMLSMEGASHRKLDPSLGGLCALLLHKLVALQVCRREVELPRAGLEELIFREKNREVER